jgi:Flp pilus assembly protein TadB
VTTRASDGERERAVASLREHFVRGRLTVEELSARCELALRARSRKDLRRALAELPPLMPQAIVRGVAQGIALVVLTGAWLVFSCVLLLAFLLTLAIHGMSALELAVFAGVWLVPTYFLTRRWRRGLSHLIRGT